MNPEDVMKLSAGPDLDRLVHQSLNLPGRIPKYSSDDGAAIKLIAHLPLFCARVPVNDPAYNPAKGFIAGTLTTHPQLQALFSSLQVKAPSLALALSKAAVIYTIMPKEQPKAPSLFVPKAAPKPDIEKMPERPKTALLPEAIEAPKREGNQ